MAAFVAPVNQISWMPEATIVCASRVPNCGAGLDETQFQESPPSEPGEAPAGRALPTHTWSGLFAWKSFSAKARRPSGHSTSASTHWSPLFTGVKVYVEPKAG